MKFIEVHPICPDSHGMSKRIMLNSRYVVNVKDAAAGCIISLLNKDTILVHESYEKIMNLLKSNAMNWLPINRDKNGFITEECLDRIQRTVPFVAATQIQNQFVYHLIKDERDFIVYKEIIYSGRDVTHYLPIPKI